MDKNTPSSARAPSPTVRVDDVPGDERRRRAIRWADDNIGRGGALAAAKTYGAAFGAAADAAGYLSGDPGMRARADIRGLLPMHLRCSVRVHHVNFLHPCIEPMTAALGDAAGEGGREGGRGKNGKRRNSDHVERLDLSYLEQVRRDGAEEDGAVIEEIIKAECRRLSRDGLLENHARRKARAMRKGDVDDMKTGGTEVKGVRRFVQLSAHSGPKNGASRNAEFVKYASKKGTKNPQKKSKTALWTNDESLHTTTLCQGERPPKNDLEQLVVTEEEAPRFDLDGVAGDGPLLASAVMETDSARLGRYLPEVACRIPCGSVRFELSRPSLSPLRTGTQPFVVEAPHVIWGSARDPLLKQSADEGNVLVDARDLEYLTDLELNLVGQTESLLVVGSTIWVDVPPEFRSDAKTAKDVAKAAKKVVKKGAKGLTHYAGATAKGIANTAKAGIKGAETVGHTTTNFVQSPAHMGFGAKTGWQSGDGDGDMVATHSGSPEKKKRFSKLSKRASKLRLRHKKKKKQDGTAAEGLSINTIEGRSHHSIESHDLDATQSDSEPKGGESEHATDSEPSNVQHLANKALAKLLRDPTPYTIVLDDIISFRIIGFPSGDVLASFQVSVASVLSTRPLQERLLDPLRPSELTVALVQEPSIEEGRWGVEAKVTFRVVEVDPNTPLAKEAPSQDEKGNWALAKVDDKRKYLATHLKNIGKSKEEIEREIRLEEEREEAEHEAFEAAIVAAGIGKGYEQGAPASEIVRRQMFFDPERAPIRRRVGRTLLTGVDSTSLGIISVGSDEMVPAFEPDDLSEAASTNCQPTVVYLPSVPSSILTPNTSASELYKSNVSEVSNKADLIPCEVESLIAKGKTYQGPYNSLDNVPMNAAHIKKTYGSKVIKQLKKGNQNEEFTSDFLEVSEVSDTHDSQFRKGRNILRLEKRETLSPVSGNKSESAQYISQNVARQSASLSPESSREALISLHKNVHHNSLVSIPEKNLKREVSDSSSRHFDAFLRQSRRERMLSAGRLSSYKGIPITSLNPSCEPILSSKHLNSIQDNDEVLKELNSEFSSSALHCCAQTGAINQFSRWIATTKQNVCILLLDDNHGLCLLLLLLTAFLSFWWICF